MKQKNPYIKQIGDKLTVTKAGYKYLDKIVTNSTGPVYAFYAEASPLMVAATMARLSRRGSDAREIYLDEFALTGDEDADSLIHRVVTAYGDDSVQQLVGLHLVVEDASNYLTKALEWGRFGAYLEQSTRYIYYDQKNDKGEYKYFIPENLDKNSKVQYKKSLNEVFGLYSKMVHSLTDYVRNKTGEPSDPRERLAWNSATRAQACDAIRPVLPIATKSTVGIFVSAQALESLIMNLLAEDLTEARNTGQLILDEARKVMPAFLERADKPDRGGATTAYWANSRASVHKLAAKYLRQNAVETKTETVELLSYWPKQETDMVPDLIFAELSLPSAEIIKAVGKLSKKQKDEIFQTYLGKRLNRRHKPGRAFEFPHYTFEVLADYGTFRDLQRHRVVDGWEWQRLGISYGYEIPDIVMEAGLQNDFRKCFEIAEKLYKQMLKFGYQAEAQYAVLFGHRVRYKFMINARAAFHFIELRSSPQGHPGYRRVVNKMHELIAQAHPKVAAAMQFVNKDEDPELTRMAAELATQYKIEKLSKP